MMKNNEKQKQSPCRCANRQRAFIFLIQKWCKDVFHTNTLFYVRQLNDMVASLGISFYQANAFFCNGNVPAYKAHSFKP